MMIRVRSCYILLKLLTNLFYNITLFTWKLKVIVIWDFLQSYISFLNYFHFFISVILYVTIYLISTYLLVEEIGRRRQDLSILEYFHMDNRILESRGIQKDNISIHQYFLDHEDSPPCKISIRYLAAI